MDAVVRVTCPGCQAGLKVPAALVGRAVKCKRCGASVRTAPPSADPPPLPPPPPYYPPAVVFAPPAYVPTPAEVFAVAPEPLSADKYRRKNRSAGPAVWVGLALVTAAGVTAAGLYGKPAFDKLLGGAAVDPAAPPTAAPSTESGLAEIAARRFPRRLLAVSITKYLYCNPLTGATEQNPDPVTVAARRLAYQWRVPTDADNDQLFVFTDTGAKARPLLKGTVRGAVEQFCATSRPQDRIAIYFGGHATVLDGKAYLVPADGDLTDAASLYPLADFYKAIQTGPAQATAVIFDVCRVNEYGDRQRPGSEPMSAELEKALLAAPTGVEVVLTCAAGQNALDLRSPPDAADGGSLFLSATTYLAATGRVKPPADPAPADPLPVGPWTAAAGDRMKMVAESVGLPGPTPRQAGADAGEAVAADDTAPPPGRVDVPPPPVGMPVAEVTKLTARINALPPYRGTPGPDDAVDALAPYPADIMKDYRPDGVTDAQILQDPDTYPIRSAAIKALEVIKREWKSGGDGADGLRSELTGATGEALKKQILREQMTPARIELDLETALTAAEKVADQLPAEKSKYWRVTYQYAVAQLKARLAFMSEYNLALGNIRTDTLPTPDPKKGEARLVLVSTEKMKSKKEVKELAEEARELFGQIAAEHKGTPWAVQAKRHQVIALGLEWKPS